MCWGLGFRELPLCLHCPIHLVTLDVELGSHHIQSQSPTTKGTKQRTTFQLQAFLSFISPAPLILQVLFPPFSHHSVPTLSPSYPTSTQCCAGSIPGITCQGNWHAALHKSHACVWTRRSSSCYSVHWRPNAVLAKGGICRGIEHNLNESVDFAEETPLAIAQLGAQSVFVEEWLASVATLVPSTMVQPFLMPYLGKR